MVTRYPRKRPEVLSVEEAARLLEAAPGIKYKAALGVAYGTGLRVSEVAHLKGPTSKQGPVWLRCCVEFFGERCGLAEARPVAAGHLDDVRATIADLKRMERVVKELVAQCADGTLPKCPLIEALFREENAARSRKNTCRAVVRRDRSRKSSGIRTSCRD